LKLVRDKLKYKFNLACTSDPLLKHSNRNNESIVTVENAKYTKLKRRLEVIQNNIKDYEQKIQKFESRADYLTNSFNSNMYKIDILMTNNTDRFDDVTRYYKKKLSYLDSELSYQLNLLKTLSPNLH